MKKKYQYEGIIVIGVPRSGTTLLRRLLDAHPHIACPGETNLLSACARFLHSEKTLGGVDFGVLSGLWYAGFKENEVLESIREFAFNFHRKYAKKQGKLRWAEKTAFDVFYLDAIEKLCGEHAYFICMQRHGLDIVCSLKEFCDKNAMYLGEVHEYIKRYPSPYEAFAHIWVDRTKAINDFVKNHKKNSLQIKYEDLVSTPEQILRGISEFIGENWDSQWIDRAMKNIGSLGFGDWKSYEKTLIDRSSVGRWENLSKPLINLVGEICNPTLKDIGYETVEIGNDISQEEARRRYKFMLKMKSSSKNKHH